MEHESALIAQLAIEKAKQDPCFAARFCDGGAATNCADSMPIEMLDEPKKPSKAGIAAWAVFVVLAVAAVAVMAFK